MEIITIIIIASIGEAVWETLKMLWQEGKASLDRIGALLIGLLLAFGAGVDLLSMVGIKMQIPFVGVLLTGILISRGANFLHDLIQSVNNINNNTK